MNWKGLITSAPYGAWVYGTAELGRSDYDYIEVWEEGVDKEEERIVESKVDITRYSKSYFQKLLDAHEISALETYFQFSHLSEHFTFKLDLAKLRASFSQKASNSWVKAKKKLIVPEDYDPYVAKKSLFHSFRILDFGCQIAEHGKIVDYSSANHIWERIKDMEPNWYLWYDTFKKEYNALDSKFKKLAPKEIKK